MLRSVPIVKVILVILFKKKKNKKEKNDPYFGMGKNTKSYATKSPAIYLFLGKGRESFVSDFIKTKTKCAFCPALQHAKYFLSSGTVWTMHAKKNSHKIDPENSFSANFAPFQ